MPSSEIEANISDIDPFEKNGLSFSLAAWAAVGAICSYTWQIINIPNCIFFFFFGAK